MFELAGAEDDVARQALKLAAQKLPIKCKVIAKGEEHIAHASVGIKSDLVAEANAAAEARALAKANANTGGGENAV
jgi:hypothetical protein